MNKKIRELTDLYNNTNKAYELILKTSERTVEKKMQENIKQIEDYLMSKLPEIKSLNCSFYVYRSGVAFSPDKVKGFALVFNGVWLITEEGIFYDKSDGYIGDNYYYSSDNIKMWARLNELSDSKLNDPYNGLFVRWKEMKNKLDSDLEKIAENKVKKLEKAIKYKVEFMSAVMDFEV